jgi:hypothetical protein
MAAPARGGRRPHPGLATGIATWDRAGDRPATGTQTGTDDRPMTGCYLSALISTAISSLMLAGIE